MYQTNDLFKLSRIVSRFLLSTLALFSLAFFTPNTQAQAEEANFEAVWSSSAFEAAAVAWADYDQDGDLDFVLGNGTLDVGAPMRLYRNHDGDLLLAAWETTETNLAYHVAWGDYDDDGDLDLAVGNACDRQMTCFPSRLYRNDNGVLSTTAVWEEPENRGDFTMKISWVDYDGDGDLDLFTGNAAITRTFGTRIPFPAGKANRLYRNNGVGVNGEPLFELVWSSEDTDMTTAVAWGDYDNDGDPDLAVGNSDVVIHFQLFPPDTWVEVGGENFIYRNDGVAPNGEPLMTLVWTSPEAYLTSDLAWVDYDRDNDLDLAVTNGSAVIDLSGFPPNIDYEAHPRGVVNQLYKNGGVDGQNLPLLTLDWESDEKDLTMTMAWGDYDRDGDLDMIVGNTIVESDDGRASPEGKRTRLYRNDDGRLTTTAVWSSPEEDLTRGVAWGDYDNDGDLDLVVASANLDSGQPTHVYNNMGTTLAYRSNTAVLPPDQTQETRAVAWGDYDGDGDLDLAVGNFGQPNQLYRNDNGQLVLDEAAWPNATDQYNQTTSLAWGDFDGDNDLDLAVGNWGQPNRLYRNNNEGRLLLEAAWSTGHYDQTYSLAWGDYEGDGDLDLAVGNRHQANLLYLAKNGLLTAQPDWETPEHDGKQDNTWSIAWGDANNDGDLDLAVGNNEEANRLYSNLGIDPETGQPLLNLTWSSEETEQTAAIAWGDYNQDGYPDLVAGNHGQPNRLYRNWGHTFTTNNSTLRFVESDDTYSLAWGDYDGDGDVDLAVGNGHAGSADEPNRLYLNEGGRLQKTAVWDTYEIEETRSIAWGDIDNDGDLDLVAGNSDDVANDIYLNPRHNYDTVLNDPPFVSIQYPGETPEAGFYATSNIIRGELIDITYSLFDAESDPGAKVVAEYSLNGTDWVPATPAAETVLTNLATAPFPIGVEHTFSWQFSEDFVKSDYVVFRLQVQSDVSKGPVMWSTQGSSTAPFRAEIPRYIKVVDEFGNPAAGVPVLAAGEMITRGVGEMAVTDQAGLLNPGSLEEGAALVALSQAFEQQTTRQCHDEWAYRLYLTNPIIWDADGNHAETDLLTAVGQQRLELTRSRPLILFNLVISVEWNATEAYLAELEQAAQAASDYLYDVTDGQMAFGNVTIFDDRVCWIGADLQISARNIGIPHAHVGGLFANDSTQVIRVSRYWNGNISNQGSWQHPDGFRTWIHEFAHYAFRLRDSYRGRQIIDGIPLGWVKTECTTNEVFNPRELGNAKATIMYSQYDRSEFASHTVPDLWSADDSCEKTAQWQSNGTSDWGTIKETFTDTLGLERWLVQTPADRPSGVMAGPEELPIFLPAWPTITIQDSGQHAPTRTLTVYAESEPYTGAFTALYRLTGQVIDQGFTDENGRLDVLGATTGDIIRVFAFNGTLYGETVVTDDLELSITLLPVALIQESTESVPRKAIIQPLSISHQQPVHTSEQSDVYAHDGVLHLHLNANSLSGNNKYVTVLATSTSLYPLPINTTLIGNSYILRADNGIEQLTQPAILTLNYSHILTSKIEPASLNLYHWQEDIKQWVIVSATHDLTHQTMSATITDIGAYAILISKE